MEYAQPFHHVAGRHVTGALLGPDHVYGAVLGADKHAATFVSTAPVQLVAIGGQHGLKRVGCRLGVLDGDALAYLDAVPGKGRPCARQGDQRVDADLRHRAPPVGVLGRIPLDQHASLSRSRHQG